MGRRCNKKSIRRSIFRLGRKDGGSGLGIRVFQSISKQSISNEKKRRHSRGGLLASLALTGRGQTAGGWKTKGTAEAEKIEEQGKWQSGDERRNRQREAEAGGDREEGQVKNCVLFRSNLSRGDVRLVIASTTEQDGGRKQEGQGKNDTRNQREKCGS